MKNLILISFFILFSKNSFGECPETPKYFTNSVCSDVSRQNKSIIISINLFRLTLSHHSFENEKRWRGEIGVCEIDDAFKICGPKWVGENILPGLAGLNTSQLFKHALSKGAGKYLTNQKFLNEAILGNSIDVNFEIKKEIAIALYHQRVLPANFKKIASSVADFIGKENMLKKDLPTKLPVNIKTTVKEVKVEIPKSDSELISSIDKLRLDAGADKPIDKPQVFDLLSKFDYSKITNEEVAALTLLFAEINDKDLMINLLKSSDNVFDYLNSTLEAVRKCREQAYAKYLETHDYNFMINSSNYNHRLFGSEAIRPDPISVMIIDTYAKSLDKFKTERTNDIYNKVFIGTELGFDEVQKLIESNRKYLKVSVGVNGQNILQLLINSRPERFSNEQRISLFHMLCDKDSSCLGMLGIPASARINETYDYSKKMKYPNFPLIHAVEMGDSEWLKNLLDYRFSFPNSRILVLEEDDILKKINSKNQDSKEIKELIKNHPWYKRK